MVPGASEEALKHSGVLSKPKPGEESWQRCAGMARAEAERFRRSAEAMVPEVAALGAQMRAEAAAQRFRAVFCRLAPGCASWDDLPDNYRRLLVATFEALETEEPRDTDL
jgi:hypothetical protein